MKTFDALVIELIDAIARCARAEGEPIVITEASVSFPIETRFAPSGALLASSPRGIMRTGFDLPHGRVGMHLVAVDPSAAAPPDGERVRE